MMYKCKDSVLALQLEATKKTHPVLELPKGSTETFTEADGSSPPNASFSSVQELNLTALHARLPAFKSLLQMFCRNPKTNSL